MLDRLPRCRIPPYQDERTSETRLDHEEGWVISIEAGGGFRSITEHVDTTTSAGRMMLQMLGAFAEFTGRSIESVRLRPRQFEGLERPVRDEKK